MNNRYVDNKIKQILNELNNKEYEIPYLRIQALENILSMLIIKLSDTYTNKIDLYTYDNKKVHEIHFKEKLGSFVLQYPPVLVNGSFVMIKPIMHLVNFSNIEVFNSTLYHELAHVLSIGEWKQIDHRTFEHTYGISTEKYIYDEETCKIIRQRKDVDNITEEINDFVSSKLYYKIENKEYKNNNILGKKKSNEYIENRINTTIHGDISKFIGYYFSNRIDELEKILLSKQYPTIESLNCYFKEQEEEMEL